MWIMVFVLGEAVGIRCDKVTIRGIRIRTGVIVWKSGRIILGIGYLRRSIAG